jgi:uncharacterized protein YtpQ (UPF0354 family)
MDPAVEPSTSWKRAIPYIKPALPDDGSEVVQLSHDDSPVLREVNADFVAAYVVDEGDYFAYVQYRDLPPGTTEADLHASALANLNHLAEGKIRVQAHGAIFALFLDGNFEASLLLLDWLWEGPLREYAVSGYVIAVPSRDVLAFSDQRNSAGIDQLTEVIGRVFPLGDHTISERLYRRIERDWVRLNEPGTSLTE